MVYYWVYTFNGAQSCGRQGHVLSEVVSVHDVHIDVNRIVSRGRRRWWRWWRSRRRWRPRHVPAFSHLLLLRMHGMVRSIQRPMPTGFSTRSLQWLHHFVFYFVLIESNEMSTNSLNEMGTEAGTGRGRGRGAEGRRGSAPPKFRQTQPRNFSCVDSGVDSGATFTRRPKARQLLR